MYSICIFCTCMCGAYVSYRRYIIYFIRGKQWSKRVIFRKCNVLCIACIYKSAYGCVSIPFVCKNLLSALFFLTICCMCITYLSHVGFIVTDFSERVQYINKMFVSRMGICTCDPIWNRIAWLDGHYLICNSSYSSNSNRNPKIYNGSGQKIRTSWKFCTTKSLRAYQHELQ